MILPEGADDPVQGIAIVGMACRFPGSADVDEFWRALRAGKEAVTFFSEEELRSAGVDPALLENPHYVRAKGVLAGVDLFDAEFFGFSPREAELTDPQQRLFLECAWTALEDAGHDPASYPGTIGVYAGAGWTSYLLFNLATQSGLLESDAGHQTLLGNDKDNLTTRVSYKLDLHGPSVAVQTGCSTSLVATALACQSLLSYHCDVALAGGVSVTVPQTGYLHRAGGILSPDGHCRAFDARAQGTVIGSGAGVVVLKRLEEAIAEGDHIYAVIKATAINNDGALKAGYTAPSVEGQTKCIVEAHALAGVSPGSITYVEAHGTGTALGDPIEVAALTRAFREGTSANGFCALGSVKTNLGHLDAAAGVAGLIKTALALQHREIPPSLHFESPNPQIDFAGGPFYVRATLAPWETGGTPRRAGVSSFGLGGTNAHAVLEEAPAPAPSRHDGSPQLLILSARTEEALESATTRLARHLREHPELELADVAHTLRVGRKGFAHRRFLICRDTGEAVRALEERDPGCVSSHVPDTGDRPVAFMFTGQGAQYVDMARELYDGEPAFRGPVDHCLGLLASRHGIDLRPLLYPADEHREDAARQLAETGNAQPALFVVEYALARMWTSWGIAMHAAIGHSIGEYVAATLAGVLALEDALALVALRGRLMQGLPRGAMLAVPLSAGEVAPLLGPNLSLAAINQPSSCVVSGPPDAIAAMRRELEAREVECQPLHTSHAFHSHMMDPMLAPFRERLRQLRLRPPRVPYVSNLTGTWITVAEATDPEYWVRHVREPVRFADGLRTLLAADGPVLLEVGPGRTLTRFAQRHPDRGPEQLVVASLRHPHDESSDLAFLRDTLGRLWLSGVRVDWPAVSRDRRHRRVRLPTYPFERQRYWIEPPGRSLPGGPPRASPAPEEIWDALVAAAEEEANAVVGAFDLQEHLNKRRSLDDLCVAQANLALRRLGAFQEPADSYTPDALARSCGIDSRFSQLFSRMLATLSEHGHLRHEGGSRTGLLPCTPETVRHLAGEARRRWANAPEVIELVESCGEALPAVLRGEQDPLELFSPVLERETSPSRSEPSLEPSYNSVLRRGVEAVLKRLPGTAALRILEIGGGTGIATAALLPVLPPERTRYTFTDVGKSFLARARQRFAAYPFIGYGILDVEQPPQEQGYPAHGYDVVVAVNMLHVTRNMGETLEHVRSLLAPGGLLLIWEITRPTPDFDVTYGLLMNPVEDGKRSQSNPFLSGSEWVDALRAHGFARVAILPDNSLLEHQILAAQATNEAPLSSRSALTPAFGSVAASPEGAPGPRSPLAKKGDVGEWFHVPSWKRSSRPLPAEPAGPPAGPWLIFADRCGLGEDLAGRLVLRGQDVLTVQAGNGFRDEGERSFTIDPARPADYAALLEELRAQGRLPSKVVHLWAVTPDHPPGANGEIPGEPGFAELHGLIFLAQALGEQNAIGSLEITVVSSHLQEVTGEETILPEKALLLGPCRVIPLEYPHVHCRSVDVVYSGTRRDERVVEQLLDEVLAGFPDPVVAYRGPHRWVQTIEPVRLERPAGVPSVLKRNGVYLITGGLGKIGLTVAEYLAKTVAAKLILTGRTGFPPPDEWERWLALDGEEGERGRTLRKLRELEALGSEVLVMSADVADLEQMRAAVVGARERFGPIDGVVHSAGLLGDGAIQTKTPEQVEEILRPKVTGTFVLDAVFRDTPLDFLVLFSSNSAVKPGFGQVAYSAANNFLDAFACGAAARGRRRVSCLSWDVWKGEGMAYDATAPLALRRLKEADFNQRGILPHEGVEVFSRVLGSMLPHVLVSTSDYLRSADLDLPRLYLDKVEEAPLPASRHVRPRLSNAYVAPGSETEETLTRIWQDLLGIDAIGVEDDFFNLGGDSLIGTQLITRVKAGFGVKLPMKSVYLHRTIRSVSTVIEDALVSQASPEKLGEVLKQLEGLE